MNAFEIMEVTDKSWSDDVKTLAQRLDRLDEIEKRLKALENEKRSLALENVALRNTIEKISDGKWEDAVEAGHWWLSAKVERQRWAINAIQWKGWRPEYVIQEQEDPNDVTAR